MKCYRKTLAVAVHHLENVDLFPALFPDQPHTEPIPATVRRYLYCSKISPIGSIQEFPRAKLPRFYLRVPLIEISG